MTVVVEYENKHLEQENIMIIFSQKNVDGLGISPKVIDTLKCGELAKVLSRYKDSRMTKQASSDASANDIIMAFAKALSDMNMTTDINIGDLFKRLLANSKSLEKTAETKSGDKQETIHIASKEIKDSHYQVDVSKDTVNREGQDLIMVSVYARESYLGRYLIKRNFFYLPDNNDGADESFKEICAKMNKIKKSYHSGRINIKAVTSEMTRVVQGILSDIKFKEEDDLGTTVKRN